MKKHSFSYEQFCWVKQKNIVLVETVFHNGTKKVMCTCFAECNGNGGCKNNTLNDLWGKSIVFCGPGAEKPSFDN